MSLEKLTANQLAKHNRDDAFLRSINIIFDADHPERVAHFQPTAKTVPLLRALAGEQRDRTWFVVAPYGSGKSLAATYILHLIENRRDATGVLGAIERRMRLVSPEFAAFSSERRRNASRFGVVVALHGYNPDLCANIQHSAAASLRRLGFDALASRAEAHSCGDMDACIDMLVDLRGEVRSAGGDRVVILWDEFGRHLQRLVMDGRASDLDEVQMLAEFSSRTSAVPVTVGLLLHQRLMHYAGSMPQSVRAEWKKVEGRFLTLHYVDDSMEMYRLIGEVVDSVVSQDRPSDAQTEAAVKRCRQLDLFQEFSGDELADLLSLAYPLEPVTLHLLPRLSARLAQNERTLFSFLYGVSHHATISPAELFDYFSPAMQSDTAIGGTYRQWLEAQSALAKVPAGETAERAIKIACLLGIGTSGERSRSDRQLLLFGLQGYGSDDGLEQVVEDLVARKLLLHRRHSDEIVLWHGTDVDLRGRLDDEKTRRRDSFDLVTFLDREVRLPVWRPVEYNADYAMRRYLSGSYVDLQGLEGYLTFELPLQGLPIGCDGRILHVVTSSDEQLLRAEQLVREHLVNPRVLVALPREPLPLFDAALEVDCLLAMQRDVDLVSTDPLVAPEIDQMTDDARGHLMHLAERLVLPGQNGPRWFHRGEELDVHGARDLRHELSRIMREVFGKTPVIRNEMINRHKPNAVMVNARKKLLLAILERSGQENLGIEGNFPDASMFRTVLLHTGLYRQDADGRWRYAMPEELGDPGLRDVWSHFRALFTEASDGPKDIRQMFNAVKEPPYGVREGLLPIFFAAGLRAFPGSRSLSRAGDYVADILPSDVEQLCSSPDDFDLTVLDLDESKTTYLRALYHLFSDVRTVDIPETDLIRECVDVLLIWKAQLPPAALTTNRVSERAQLLRDAIGPGVDPVHLLLETLPRIAGGSVSSPDEVLRSLEELRTELQGIASVYRSEAEQALRLALALGSGDAPGNLRDAADRWSRCFPDDFVQALPTGPARGLLARMRMPYPSDAQLVESLASLITGKTLRRWEDDTVEQFDRQLQRAVREVEERALTMRTAVSRDSTAAVGLAELLCGRIANLYEQLTDLAGPETARDMIETLLDNGDKNED